MPIHLAVGLEVYRTTIDVDLPAREDLVVYLNFDRNGGKRARNLASFRHHAEVRAAKWIPNGKRNGAYEFNGDAQLVIPHHDELCPVAYTLAAWVLPQDPAGPWRHVMSKTKASFYGGYGFCRYPKDNANMSFYVGDYNSALVKQPVPKGEWVHIAGVCDGKQVQLFVNGEPSLPLALPRKMEHTKTPFIIGGFSGYDWIGGIDEVTFFRRSLSNREIEQLMLATAGRQQNQ
ncbi:MAG: LamG domain-containing protein [Planctomycetota bacterium]|nr:LamG domain-containing protein [Planctomycetota bacterium]